MLPVDDQPAEPEAACRPRAALGDVGWASRRTRPCRAARPAPGRWRRRPAAGPGRPGLDVVACADAWMQPTDACGRQPPSGVPGPAGSTSRRGRIGRSRPGALRPDLAPQLGKLVLAPPSGVPALHEQPHQQHQGNAEGRPDIGRVAAHREEVGQARPSPCPPDVGRARRYKSFAAEARHGLGVGPTAWPRRITMLGARTAGDGARGPARRSPGWSWRQRSAPRLLDPSRLRHEIAAVHRWARRPRRRPARAASRAAAGRPRARYQAYFEAGGSAEVVHHELSRQMDAVIQGTLDFAQARALRQLQPDHGRGAGGGRRRRLRPPGAGARLRHRSAVPLPLQAHAPCRADLRVPALQAVGPGSQGRPGGPLGERDHQARQGAI